MPSILEDPSTKIPPPQSATKAAPLLPPRHTHLTKPANSPNTPVTLYPITNGPQSLPADLVRFLHSEFSAEIQRGSTYPMEEAMSVEKFAEYWFGTFAVVAVLGDGQDGHDGGELREGRDWEKECLGTFYVKPNYPGLFFFSSLFWDGLGN